MENGNGGSLCIEISRVADAFNLFNNVRFGGINTNITNTAFGRVTAQVNTPRVVQFKAKIVF